MASVVKALKGVATLEDIAAAFETDHELVFSGVEVKPDGTNSSIEIGGQFFDRRSGRYVGKFVRKLRYINKEFLPHHGLLELEDLTYSRRGIAKSHYQRAMAFYRNILGATSVTLDADFMGPYVWGDFGFEFAEDDWTLMLARFEQIHYAHCGYAPHRYPETATGLRHFVAADGFPIGEEAIRAVHAARGSLRMVLDFGDNTSIQILREKGIL